MRYLPETSVRYTSTIKDALLKKSQVPAALGFRTVAEAARVQHVNMPVQLEVNLNAQLLSHALMNRATSSAP